MTQDEHHRLETTGGDYVDHERPKWVLSPTSDFKKKWDIAQAFILFYLAILVPIRVGFSIQAFGAGYVLDLFVDIYFWLDIIVNFRSGFEDQQEGTMVYDLGKIRQNYLSTWFTLDVVASLPIDLAIRLGQGNFVCSLADTCVKKVVEIEPEGAENKGQLFRLFKLFRLVRLVKMLRLIRLQRLLERYQDELFDIMPAIKMCKLVFILVLLGHIFGCFFYFFSTDDYRYEDEKQQIIDGDITPWMISEFAANIPDPGTGTKESYLQTEYFITEEVMLGKKYIASMYWAFTTMTTVGYGDISAKTMSERIFAMVGMLVGGFVFSALIGTISKVFESRDLSKLAKHRRIDLVSAFVRDSAMPKQLRLQVLGFFRKQDVRAYDERVFLQQMPYQIRHDVLRHCHGDLIKEVPIFQGASDVFITEVLFCLDPKTFVAGVIVTQKGEVGNEMYLLASGDVELLEDDQSTVVKVLPAGSYFGEEVCLGHAERQMNVRAKTNCRVCCLAKDEINLLLDQWPHIRENIRAWYTKRMEHFMEFTNAPKEGQSVGVTNVKKKKANHIPHRDSISLMDGTEIENFIKPDNSSSKTASGPVVAGGAEGPVEARLGALENKMTNISSTLDTLKEMMIAMDAKLNIPGPNAVVMLPKIQS